MNTEGERTESMEELEEGVECYELSSRHDMSIVLMNLLKLWLPAQDLNKCGSTLPQVSIGKQGQLEERDIFFCYKERGSLFIPTAWLA